MGSCMFGATCKFHHPKDKAGIAGRVQLNVLGYPLHSNEKECAYYLWTGQCKFGGTCKFDHPQPSNAMVSLHGSPVYTSLHSPTTPGQQYPRGLANWPLSRASFIPGPRWQGRSSFALLILPQGLVQVPSWNTFSGQLGSASSSEGQQTSGGNQFYGSPRQSQTTTGAQRTTSYLSGSVPLGQYAVQRDNLFPERPDQPKCQFYMKTGDCKFGAVCRFHHPRERFIPAPNCVLSPLGLPLHPGELLCIFYSRYGICKFGPNCKFDHPMGIFAYSISTPSSPHVLVVQHLLGTSVAPPILTLYSENSIEAGPGSRRLSLSDSRQMASKGNNIKPEVSHVSQSIGQIPSFS